MLEIRSDNSVTFAPSDGTWLLLGTARPDGTISAAASRPGADKRPFVTRLDAVVTADTIKGSYKTPRCVYDVTLSRVLRP